MTFAEISSHSIRGVIDRIEFKNCEITSIRPFAIGVADPLAYQISMDLTIIHRIESQVTHKIIKQSKLRRCSCAHDKRVHHAIQFIATFFLLLFVGVQEHRCGTFRAHQFCNYL